MFLPYLLLFSIDDLCRAASISVDTSTQGILAAIFTSLACNTELRKDMVCRNSPGEQNIKKSYMYSMCDRYGWIKRK